MAEGLLESKRAAFARADAILRHVVLLKVRNSRLGGPLTALQAQDVNKVQPAELLAVHAVHAQLIMNAKDPAIITAFMDIVSPEPNRTYSPVALLAHFEDLTRAELGLPPLHLAGEGSFAINLDCNVLTLPALVVQNGK